MESHSWACERACRRNGTSATIFLRVRRCGHLLYFGRLSLVFSTILLVQGRSGEKCG
jgi:hypothetical protein